MSIQNLTEVLGESEKTGIFQRSKQEVPMSDRFASLHCPPLGSCAARRLAPGLSKVLTSHLRNHHFMNSININSEL